VREVVDAARRVTGREIPCEMAPRRPGDPATLVASSKRAREVLGWKPAWTDMDGIIESAWRWLQGGGGR
jgi:UDP-glucose 4-epimerase